MLVRGGEVWPLTLEWYDARRCSGTLIHSPGYQSREIIETLIWNHRFIRRGGYVLKDDPVTTFQEVYKQAIATGIEIPNAMAVSSVDAEGQPWSRMVLLKHFDSQGFVFYTNLESHKGFQIRSHPRVCLSFFWRELHRQVTILGEAELVSDEEADAYFATRPRGSQLGAWASDQRT